MGCFSFLCKECGRGILSSSFDGEPVTLYLLHNGKVIEQMEGEYDSYGRVFEPGNNDSYKWKANINPGQTDILSKEVMDMVRKHSPEEQESILKSLKESSEQKKGDSWSRVCDLMFSDNEGDGIAAVHVRCKEAYGKIPTTQSADDPNQGWGNDMELMSATSMK